MSLPYFPVVNHTIMMNFIENVLCHFESCFSRKAAFRWFVTIIIGLMLRSDKLGVTSVIRDLALSPGCYDSMLHFSGHPHGRWRKSVNVGSPLSGCMLPYREGNYHVLVGDGVKQSKEGRRMPGVKKLFQESENSAKPEYIHGHMFGGLGILAGSVRNLACIPLSIRLHDGLQAAMEWKGASVSEASHVVQMVEDAYRAALTFGNSLLLLDRYFLTVPALEKLKSLNGSAGCTHGDRHQGQKSCTAFERPVPANPEGTACQKGAAVHLKELFASRGGNSRKRRLNFMEKGNPSVTTALTCYGAEAVSGTALRPGGNEWRPGHPCKHQPGAGSAVHHPALQLPVPD